MDTKATKTDIVTRAAKGTLFGGALVVTGFASAADFSGASAQVAKSIDAGFAPLAGSHDLETERLVFGSNAALGAQQFVIRDQRAWVIGSDAQERPAPDGFYRLSNNRILKVAGGRVFHQSILALGSKGWKDWIRKSTGRAPAVDADVQSVYLSLLG